LSDNGNGEALADGVGRWADAVGLARGFLPGPAELRRLFRGSGDVCRPPADPAAVDAWERRHGFRLPESLRAWLLVSDGLYRGAPLIHPLTAIGPMIPFARVPGLFVQPESWFELGNPGTETVCIDLGYAWPGPGGDCPIFSSGDDLRASPPRLIAPSFSSWLVRLLLEGGREYWLDPGFEALGDPWREHRDRAPIPPLPDRLRPFAPCVRPLMRPGADDRTIASSLGLSRGDVEALFRHLQHDRAGASPAP
jgi:hypothetical protein